MVSTGTKAYAVVMSDETPTTKLVTCEEVAVRFIKKSTSKPVMSTDSSSLGNAIQL